MDKVDCISEILEKYSTIEEQLDKKLEKLKQDDTKLSIADEKNSSSSPEPYRLLNLEEAKLRNTNLLKSLEISKARLRSRSTFSPIEQILQVAIDNYRKKPALAPRIRLEDRHTAQAPEILSDANLTQRTLSRSSVTFD